MLAIRDLSNGGAHFDHISCIHGKVTPSANPMITRRVTNVPTPPCAAKGDNIVKTEVAKIPKPKT